MQSQLVVKGNRFHAVCGPPNCTACCSSRSLVGTNHLSSTEQHTGGRAACGVPAKHWSPDQLSCRPVAAQRQQPMLCLWQLGVRRLYWWPSHGPQFRRSASDRCCRRHCRAHFCLLAGLTAHSRCVLTFAVAWVATASFEMSAMAREHSRLVCRNPV